MHRVRCEKCGKLCWREGAKRGHHKRLYDYVPRGYGRATNKSYLVERATYTWHVCKHVQIGDDEGGNVGDPVAGKEAEELRQALEKLMADHIATEMPIGPSDIQRILDEVDARDALAYVINVQDSK